MAVVFDLLRAIAEYWFRIKNGISWGTFWFQIEEYERVNAAVDTLDSIVLSGLVLANTHTILFLSRMTIECISQPLAWQFALKNVLLEVLMRKAVYIDMTEEGQRIGGLRLSGLKLDISLNLWASAGHVCLEWYSYLVWYLSYAS